MKQVYLETILLIERLHRRFLDVVKSELDRLKVEDINNKTMNENFLIVFMFEKRLTFCQKATKFGPVRQRTIIHKISEQNSYHRSFRINWYTNDRTVHTTGTCRGTPGEN